MTSHGMSAWSLKLWWDTDTVMLLLPTGWKFKISNQNKLTLIESRLEVSRTLFLIIFSYFWRLVKRKKTLILYYGTPIWAIKLYITSSTEPKCTTICAFDLYSTYQMEWNFTSMSSTSRYALMRHWHCDAAPAYGLEVQRFQ